VGRRRRIRPEDLICPPNFAECLPGAFAPCPPDFAAPPPPGAFGLPVRAPDNGEDALILPFPTPEPQSTPDEEEPHP